MRPRRCAVTAAALPPTPWSNRKPHMQREVCFSIDKKRPIVYTADEDKYHPTSIRDNRGNAQTHPDHAFACTFSALLKACQTPPRPQPPTPGPGSHEIGFLLGSPSLFRGPATTTCLSASTATGPCGRFSPTTSPVAAAPEPTAQPEKSKTTAGRHAVTFLMLGETQNSAPEQAPEKRRGTHRRTGIHTSIRPGIGYLAEVRPL